MAKELVDIRMLVLRDEPSDKAIKVTQEDEAGYVWLPRSEIEFVYDDHTCEFAVITMPEWLAIEKGLV